MPFFETKFARLEYAGTDRFRLAFMRHTEEWIEVYPNTSFEKCLALIQAIRCLLHKVRMMDTTKDIFKPGAKVVWLKRIPGGDYVYPVSATVLAVTAKRVKIEAHDDGKIVVRFVPPQSLQCVE
jgi:hypothetical protein